MRLKFVPTCPDKVWPEAIIGAPAEMFIVTSVGELAPPGPDAVTGTVKFPSVVGVPENAPVDADNVNPVGSVVAAHAVAGRFAEFCRVGLAVKAAPTLPVKICPDVMLGAPRETEMIADTAVLVPPGPVATMVIDLEPLFVGVPEISPVVAFIDAQAGNPVAVQDVAGRFAGSDNAGDALKSAPTAPANDWPGIIIGSNVASAIRKPNKPLSAAGKFFSP